MKRLFVVLILTIFIQGSAVQCKEHQQRLSDSEALANLQKIVAQRGPYTPELSAKVRVIVFQLGKKNRYRHQVTTLLNLHQGYADLLFSKSFPPFAESIPNFARVDRKLYRGGQPNTDGFRQLKEMGVKTIINLRLEDSSEEAIVKDLGLNYVHIPIPDTTPPTKGQTALFLKILNENRNDRVFVHCAAGKNRTSAMVSVWRIEHGMKPSDALRESLKFGLHPDFLAADRIEDFILRYRSELK